jgi:hypothetical protein
MLRNKNMLEYSDNLIGTVQRHAWFKSVKSIISQIPKALKKENRI